MVDFDDLYVYVPEVNEIIRISEGSGDNLDNEEIANGYVDYIDYGTYELDLDMPQKDGGELLKKELIRESYGSLSECIPEVLEFAYDRKDMKYVILTPEGKE